MRIIFKRPFYIETIDTILSEINQGKIIEKLIFTSKEHEKLWSYLSSKGIDSAYDDEVKYFTCSILYFVDPVTQNRYTIPFEVEG